MRGIIALILNNCSLNVVVFYRLFDAGIDSFFIEDRSGGVLSCYWTELGV